MYTENGLMVDVGEIRDIVKSADVFAIGFRLFPERLLIDTRYDSDETPMVAIVDPVESVQEHIISAEPLPCASLLVRRHRLLAFVGEVDDREATVPEEESALAPVRAAVRTSMMNERNQHGLETWVTSGPDLVCAS